MAEIRMCDQKNPDGSACGEPAVHSYRWDWGQTGACCQAHGLLMQQTAVNLSSQEVKRNVSLAPLENAAEAPLDRSERTALIAARLSAEAECEEIRERSAQLYRANVDLTGQVQSLTLRLREADAQLELASKKHAELNRKLKDRDVELATVTDELQRLQTLAAFAPETSVSGKSRRPAQQTVGESKPEPSKPEPKGG